MRVRCHIESLGLRPLPKAPWLPCATCQNFIETHLLVRYNWFPSYLFEQPHRSRTGIISPWVQLDISDLCMVFDLVPETRSLGLHRLSELNFGEWWSNHEWHLRRIFLRNPRAISNFRCHLCGDWFSSSRGRSAHLCATHVFQCGKVVCQRMRVLPLLQGHFFYASKTVNSPDRFSENEVFGMVHVQCWSHGMRSSVLTSLIVPFGHKPGDLATRNLDQPPEPLGKMDEKLGDMQFYHPVQKCSFEVTLLPQCVEWLHQANEAVDCHNSASSALESSLKFKKSCFALEVQEAEWIKIGVGKVQERRRGSRASRAGSRPLASWTSPSARPLESLSSRANVC